MLCYFMLYHPLFDVSPLRVMLCYAMLCYAMLSYAILWYHKKHYITKTCASRDERSESREALISQKHCTTKNITSQKHAPRETNEASLARRLYHKNGITKNITSQKHAPRETSEASLARRLYHKNMVSQILARHPLFHHSPLDVMHHQNIVSQKRYITKTWYDENSISQNVFITFKLIFGVYAWE